MQGTGNGTSAIDGPAGRPFISNDNTPETKPGRSGGDYIGHSATSDSLINFDPLVSSGRMGYLLHYYLAITTAGVAV